MSSEQEDPWTCRHNVGSITYNLKGARCRDCGREWFAWTNKKGAKVWLTEPRLRGKHE